MRYTQAVLMVTAQIAACNVWHPVNERCARWLLTAHGRAGVDVLLPTQEFLAKCSASDALASRLMRPLCKIRLHFVLARTHHRKKSWATPFALLAGVK